MSNRRGNSFRRIAQHWSLDALGNWTAFDDGTLTQSRTHNAGNQLTGIDDGTTTTDFDYDPNGNLRGEHDVDDQFYDAWNRLKSSGSAVYEYDALGRRITTDPDGSSTTTATTDLYYSAQWQVLEEKRGTWVAQNVFSPFYVDDIIYHHSPSEILSAEQDVNHNVVAVVSQDSFEVVERYAYDPYGEVTYLNADGSLKTIQSSGFGWVYLFQGGRLDTATNTIDFRRRIYGVDQSRWMQQDPKQYVDGSNLYQFVISNPVNSIDPMGTDRYISNEGFHQNVAVDIWTRLRDAIRYSKKNPPANR